MTLLCQDSGYSVLGPAKCFCFVFLNDDDDPPVKPWDRNPWPHHS